jgi:hypothetical protein
VTEVAAGANDSLAITSTGAVYGWGSNRNGILGQDPNAGAVPFPALIASAPPDAVSIAAGSSSSFILTASGQVYGLGFNEEGSLGVGESTVSTSTPEQLTFPGNAAISAISASGNNGYAITTDGYLYAWGPPDDGVLGGGDLSNTVAYTPQAVDLPKSVTVTAVAATDSDGAHALALTSTGRVYAWGGDMWGQLANGTTDRSEHVVPTAIRLPTGVRFATVTAGEQSDAAVTTTGMVYAWGAGVAGQLGDGSSATVTRPSQIPMPQGARAYGVAGSSQATLALVAPEPPPRIRPVINGLPRVGNRLSCAPSQPVPVGSVASWRWVSGSTVVATTKTYTVQRRDHGVPLRCALHLNDGYGAESRISRPVVPSWQTSVASQRLPRLSGRHKTGAVERVSNGRWTPRPTAWHYQWYIGSTAIRGATRQHLRIPVRAAGKTIRCAVEAGRHDDNPGTAFTSQVTVTR